MARISTGLVALAVILGAATPVIADDTGFASMHDLRREKGKMCMTDHYHQGGGNGATKKAATNAAIKSWQDFTALEYGSDWARFSKAASKSISCSQVSTGYECNIEARACK